MALVREMGETHTYKLLPGDVPVRVDIGGLKITQHSFIFEMHPEGLHRLHEAAHVYDALVLGIRHVEGRHRALLHALRRQRVHGIMLLLRGAIGGNVTPRYLCRCRHSEIER